MLVDKENQPRFKQVIIVKCLGLCDIDISTAKLGQDSRQMCASLEFGADSHRCDGRRAGLDLKNNNNKDEKFPISSWYPLVTLNSQKDKVKR